MWENVWYAMVSENLQLQRNMLHWGENDIEQSNIPRLVTVIISGS